MTRRNFVKSTAGFVAVTGTLGLAKTALGAGPQKAWTVACRDVHLKTTGKPDSWSAMKDLGVKGAEVTVNEDLLCSSLYHPDKKYTLASEESLKALQDDLAAHQLVITAFCMHNRLDERLEEEVAWTRKLAAAALKLGVPTIRIDVVPRAVKREAFLPFAIQACKRLCETVAGTPVRFGIENHGNTTNDPEFLERLFDGVGSAQMGLTLDAMNFYWYGHPLENLYGIYTKFAPRVFHTHCKNLRYPEDKRNTGRPLGWEYEKYSSPVYDGDIDYARVAAILRQANYQGDLCLENECLGKFPADQRAEVLKKETALLRRLAGA